MAVTADYISKKLANRPRLNAGLEGLERGVQRAGTVAARQNGGYSKGNPDQVQDAALDIPELKGKVSPAQLNSLSGTKYAGMLQQAAQRGGNAVNTLHFRLSQQDPEYQRLMKQASEQ